MNKNYLKPATALIALCGIGAIYIGNGFLSDSSSYHNGFSILSFNNFRKSDWVSGQSEKLIWKPENVKYKNGKLVLSVDSDGDIRTGGEVFSKESFGYGMYEVNMRPIKNPGVVSAFFNYVKEDDTGTEIDIEFLGYDTTKVQFNYYTNGVSGERYLYDLGFDASEDYHTYGFNWMKDSIVWYVDNEPVYEANKNIPILEAPIAMDAWPTDDAEWAGEYDGTTPLYAYYDWISYTAPDKTIQKND
ncbi:family 16 glycosylhydrolase [Butyrivibrio sp. MB2005]|uniref:family 16 glycosylhydrolase n=1 Tax=Butyrivibrio sp. MB2005 TaxID=1280678 RepID=UPI0003FA68BD|nr:family 16 glycosylhydrolase [Butyrivibrio sp. MB2005]